MDRSGILQVVRDVLYRAGFQTAPGDRGLVVEATADGVLVGWQPDPALLHPMIRLAHSHVRDVPDAPYGDGIRQVMTTAVAAVLEEAGLKVHAADEGLFVTRPHVVNGAKPPPSGSYPGSAAAPCVP